MLHEFLTANRSDLIDRCRAKVAQRPSPAVTVEELEHGVPLFLDQLIKTLVLEQTTEPLRSRDVSGPSGGGTPVVSEMSVSATQHGRELSHRGFTVEQVVHDYGDVCQAIMDLAVEVRAPIAADEFRTLNRSLDNVIAVAVTEFVHQRGFVNAEKYTEALNERSGA